MFFEFLGSGGLPQPPNGDFLCTNALDGWSPASEMDGLTKRKKLEHPSVLSQRFSKTINWEGFSPPKKSSEANIISCIVDRFQTSL